MNKTELIEKIAAGADLSKADAKKALDATVKAIKDALADGDKIGRFWYFQRERTPRTRRYQPRDQRENPDCSQEGGQIQGWRRTGRCTELRSRPKISYGDVVWQRRHLYFFKVGSINDNISCQRDKTHKCKTYGGNE